MSTESGQRIALRLTANPAASPGAAALSRYALRLRRGRRDEFTVKPAHAVAISVLVSALAMADVRISEPVSEAFKALDRNSDQLISKQEAAADKSLQDRFAAVDSDADGYLDESEFLARPNDRAFE